ncbi:LysM peptidoglycan-binding domain-containing protein [Lacinutrix iliipiscaria]|uniref:LysM peptidoglycan-binding domain-containing protein n=1 Tax=Lacinutrix iliipiscaria TaxID=1230532 RepID=A0ABW5WKP8_9FLAO
MKKLLYILSLVLMFNCASTQAQNYKTHRVKSGETIESIAKEYSVTPYDIYALNPDAKKGLKDNALLIIPKSKVTSQTNTTTVKELDGFKEHKVKRKETLYSLAQKYNVEQDDIKKHNPSLYSKNLRRGDRIKIPIYKTKQVVEVIETTKDYTVLPKEGKWRIAYKFGITVDELEALNPDMNAVLTIGEVIKVPNITTEEVKEIDERYSYYTVLPKEGFYRLKLKLGVEQEDLEALNPGLKESGLKSGMVLKVPYSSQLNEAEAETSSSNLSSHIKNYDAKRIAILLPFRLDRVNTDSIYDAKKQIQNDNFLRSSLDFYSGILMAVDSLKNLGISLKVDVYDTKNQLSEVSYLLNSKDLESADAVIGPLMPKNLERVASDLKRKKVPVFSPNLKDLKLSDNVFQSMPSSDLLITKIVNFVKADSTKNHVIVISDSKNVATSNALKREFGSASLISSRKDKEGKDSYYVMESDIVSKLKPGKNIIFLETENYTFVSNVTSILNSLNNEDHQIILTTTNMNGAFENDEISNYHLSNLNFHFPTVSKTYNEDDNNGFSKRYKLVYNETPNKTAVRGFDLMMDVVLRLSVSDDIYNSVNEFPLTEYVENKFAYKKHLFGGYYNDTIYVVKYQDLKIIEAK